LGSCTAKNLGIVTSQKIKSTNCGPVYLLNKNKRKLPAGQGLRVLRLMFEPLSYDACSIPNVVPGTLCKPFDGPLHRRLQGDTGVLTPEAHEHVVDHRLCQGAALLLQATTNGLFQLGYLPPHRVKKWEHDASLCCHVPSPDRAEAEGCQSGVCLAQEAPDVLSISNSGGLEVLQPLLGDDQLLHLPLHQLPLPGCQSGLLVHQAGLPAIGVELPGQDLGTGVL
jgi:hypothetical protein